MTEGPRALPAPAERRRGLDAHHHPWRHQSLGGLFEAAAAQVPNRPIVLTEGREISYGEMARWARRLAAGLADSGLGVGDHIALLMANGPEFVAAKLAVALLGAVAVPLNFNLLRDELHYVVRQSKARALIAMDGFQGRDYVADLEAIAPPGLELFIHPLAGIPHRWRTIAALEVDSTRFEPAAVRPDQLSDVIYTSGTTGLPKGVMLTHDMVLRTGFASARVRAFQDGRRLLFAAPMYHVHGYVECLVACLFVGGAVIPQAKFNAAALLDLAVRHRADEISGVPTLTEKLLDSARERGFPRGSVAAVFNTGSANRPEIWREIRELLGPAEILTAYGMTETTASTTCTLPEGEGDRLLSTNGCLKDAGPAAPDPADPHLARYKAIDPVSGADLSPGSTGELVVRGPGVTAGYFDKPEETAAAFTPDGWLRTGDLGRIGADGYLKLSGRIKETFRCGGETVMPREIEALLETADGVAQAIVVGVPDPRMGEVGCACIVAGGARPSTAALTELCEGRLARFKVPRHFLFFEADEIPLTPTGRPRKYQLAELARARLGG